MECFNVLCRVHGNVREIFGQAAVFVMVAQLPVAIQAQQAQPADWDSYDLAIHCAVNVFGPRPVAPVLVYFLLGLLVRKSEGVARTCCAGA